MYSTLREWNTHFNWLQGVCVCGGGGTAEAGAFRAVSASDCRMPVPIALALIGSRLPRMSTGFLGPHGSGAGKLTVQDWILNAALLHSPT